MRDYPETNRSVKLHWGSERAGNLAVVYASSDSRLRHYATHRPGLLFGWNYDDSPFDLKKQVSLVRAIVKDLGGEADFSDQEIDGEMVYLPRRKGLLKKTRKTNSYSSWYKMIGKNVYDITFSDALTKKQSLVPFDINAGAKVDSIDGSLESTDRFQRVTESVFGPPTTITMDFDYSLQELPRAWPAIRQVARTYSYQSHSMDFVSRFEPLARQSLVRGQVRAYPLALLLRHDYGKAPMIPLLALNVVHAHDGSWFELQSCGGREWIEDAAKILGGKPEYWDGTEPSTRWGWYTDRWNGENADYNPVATATQKTTEKKSANKATSKESPTKKIKKKKKT